MFPCRLRLLKELFTRRRSTVYSHPVLQKLQELHIFIAISSTMSENHVRHLQPAGWARHVSPEHVQTFPMLLLSQAAATMTKSSFACSSCGASQFKLSAGCANTGPVPRLGLWARMLSPLQCPLVLLVAVVALPFPGCHECAGSSARPDETARAVEVCSRCLGNFNARAACLGSDTAACGE